MMTNNSKLHISTSGQPSYSAAAKKFNSYNSPSNSKNSSDYNKARPGLAFGQTALVKNKPGMSSGTEVTTSKMDEKEGDTGDGKTDERLPDGKWQIVNNRRKKATSVKGLKKVSEKSTIRGVENTMDVYIGRCTKSVTCDIISKYFEGETKIKVINCYDVSRENSEIQSINVTVPSGDRDAFLDGSLCPENVLARKSLKKITMETSSLKFITNLFI